MNIFMAVVVCFGVWIAAFIGLTKINDAGILSDEANILIGVCFLLVLLFGVPWGIGFLIRAWP